MDHLEERPDLSNTGLLQESRSGNKEAAQQLIALVYDELHRMAQREMRREHGEHTLQTTALVHEAYLRLFQNAPIDWKDRHHFFAVAARQLRHVLMDHARQQRSVRRGGDVKRVSIWDSDGAAVAIDERLLAVDQALKCLENLDARSGKVVELRFFARLSDAEAANVLEVSVATLKKDWEFAKAWLTRQLS